MIKNKQEKDKILFQKKIRLRNFASVFFVYQFSSIFLKVFLKDAGDRRGCP